jgi:tetratricopeptide (TPR) repeat protein
MVRHLIHFIRIFVLLFLASLTWAQSQPPAAPIILAGSPEDKALRVVEDETDAAKRTTMLDQFVKDFPPMVQSPEVNTLYVVAYQQLRNNAKVVEFSEKVLAVKPKDIDVLPLLINALLDQQNQYDKAYDYAKRYQEIAKDFEAAGLGRTFSEADRTRIQAEAKTLYDGARQQKEYYVLQAAYQENDADKKINTLEGFAKEFPDSLQICSAYSVLAVTYLQKKNVAQSADAAEKCLKVDANNLDMLVLLADEQMEDKKKAVETAELVRRAVDLADALESQPVPEGQSAGDWTKRKNYFRGTAHGQRGYIALKSALYAKALPDLELAYKMLGDDSATLYRLGFTLAKLRRTGEAQTYLSRAASMPGPFQQAAKSALSQLNR